MNKKVLSFFLVFFIIFQYIEPVIILAKQNDFVITTVNGIQIGQKSGSEIVGAQYDITDDVCDEKKFNCERGKCQEHSCYYCDDMDDHKMNYSEHWGEADDLDDYEIEFSDYKNMSGISLNSSKNIDVNINWNNNGHEISEYRYELYSLKPEYDDGELDEFELEIEGGNFVLEGNSKIDGISSGLKGLNDDKKIKKGWVPISSSGYGFKINLDEHLRKKELALRIEFAYEHGNSKTTETRWIGIINKGINTNEPTVTVTATSEKTNYKVEEQIIVEYKALIDNIEENISSGIKSVEIKPIVKLNGENFIDYKALESMNYKNKIALTADTTGVYTFGAIANYTDKSGKSKSITFNNLLTVQVSKVDTNENYLNINLATSKNEYNSGDEFPLYINIEPKDIEQSIVRPSTSKKKIVILFDTSGSMIQNKIYGKTRLDIAKDSCNGFLESLKTVSGVEVALIPFSTSSYETYKSESEKLQLGFSNNIANVQSYLNNLRYSKNESSNYAFLGTNIGDALRIANGLFGKVDKNEEKHLILFTDGFPTAFTTTDLNSVSYVTDDTMVAIKNRYSRNSEWYYEGTNGRHVKSYSGDSDKNNNALNYAVKMAETTKSLGVKSSVVGFTEGANHNKLMKITNTLEGKYYIAKDSTSLDKVFNEIKDETLNNITFTDIQVNVNHEGFSVIGSSYDRVTNGNITTVKIPKLTLELDSKTGKYVGNDINIELKLKAKDVTADTDRTIVGDMAYKDFKGNNCISSGSKVLKIKPKSSVLPNLIDIKMSSSKNEYKIGEEFEIEAKISSNPIAVTENNSKKKQIAILFDTSGSMGWDMAVQPHNGHVELARNCYTCYPGDIQGNDGEEKFCSSHMECYVWKYEKVNIFGFEFGSWEWTQKCSSSNGNRKTRMSVAKEQSIKFIDSFSNNKNIEFALIPFSYTASTKSGQISGAFENASSLKTRINSLRANGSTNIGDALRVVSYIFDENSEKYIILLTDGNPTTYSYENYNSYYLGSGVNSGFRTPRKENETKGLKYAQITGALCKDKKINSYVIGFTDGIENNKLTQIANSLGGQAYKANDENALQAVVNEISKSINETMKISTTVEVQLPPGVQLSKDSGLTAVDGKVTIPVEMKYTLNSSKTQYEAAPENVKIKLTSVRETGTPTLLKEFNGEVKYDNGKVSQDTLFIKISENTSINPPELVMDLPQKVMAGSEFYVYNSIIPKEIPKAQYSGNEDKIVLKNVQLTIESKGSIEAVDYESYGFDLIDGKYQKFIEEIVYVYDNVSNSYKVQEPIYIPLKLEAVRPGVGNITSTLTYDGYTGPKITQMATIDIDDFEKLAASQIINKSNVDIDEEFAIEYLVSSIPFKLESSDASKIIKDIELEIEVPNGVEIASEQVINNKIRIADSITFIKGEDGYYRAQQLESITIDYKLLGGNAGDLLKFGGNVKYKDFDNEQLKTVSLSEIDLKVAFQAPKISLELEQEKTTGKLTIKNNDTFKCKVDIIDEYGTVLEENVEITGGASKKIAIDKLPKGYIIVKATRDDINYSEERVPVIYVDDFEFKNSYGQNEGGKYYRNEIMKIIAPDGSKIKNINIADKADNVLYNQNPTNNTVNGGSFQQDGVKLIHGENKIKVEASYNNNITKYTETSKIDATPPTATITESEDKKDLIIEFSEIVKNEFKLTIDPTGKNITLDRNQLDSFIKEIANDGIKTTITIRLPETEEEYESLGLTEGIRGKEVVLSAYKDLSNNVGTSVTHKISSNREEEVYIITTDITINGKKVSEDGVTVVKELELLIDAKLKIVYDGPLTITIKGDSGLEIYDAQLKGDIKGDVSVTKNPDRSINIHHAFSSLSGTESNPEFNIIFKARAPKSILEEKSREANTIQKKISININGENLPPENGNNKRTVEIKLNILDINLE